MNDTVSQKTQNKKAEELHFETQQWKSKLHFMHDEVIFIDQLLTSHVFEPNTLNLFERLQDYQHRLQKEKINMIGIEKGITKHQADLGGMLECTHESCDLEYYQKHDNLKAEVINCLEKFRVLKSEIFNYAGGILKKRKPTKE
jgi:hypothetical protein